SRSGSNVQDCVSDLNRRVVDKCLRDRREHLPDDFAVFLPERCGRTPCADDRLLSIHRHQKIIAKPLGRRLPPLARGPSSERDPYLPPTMAALSPSWVSIEIRKAFRSEYSNLCPWTLAL